MGDYYKIPASFSELVTQKSSSKVDLETSLRQHIRLIVMSRIGSLRYDETYGSIIWERDFEVSLYDKTSETLSAIRQHLIDAVKKYEPRIIKEKLDVKIELKAQNRTEKYIQIDITCNLIDYKETPVRLTFLMNVSPILPFSNE